MYNSMLHFHSGLRWTVLVLLVYVVFNAFSKWRFGKDFSRIDRLFNLLSMITFHIQFLAGLILYFISPKVNFGGMKDPMLRFFTVEHSLMMILAMVFITLGYSRMKKAEKDKAKHRKVFIWYGLCLLLILISIPWPFRTDLGAHWY